MSDLVPADPTASVELDFAAYVRQRAAQLSLHILGGVPDYAFSLDAKLRAKLASISLLRTIGQALNAATVPFQRQILLMEGIAVGPRQLPEIHAIGEECARLLGIGVPQIFITRGEPNAYTYATNDVDQIIVLTSELLEDCELSHLKFIIGHECGHIHNQHTVYNTIWELLVNPIAKGVLAGVVQLTPGLNMLSPLLQTAANASLNYLFGRWHRCAEFTCDRAGLICCGDVETAMMAYARLHTGGAALLQDFNPAEYAKQLNRVSASPMRFREAQASHPIGPKRIEALHLFSECETLYSWRPEMRADTTTARSRADVDADCEHLVN